MKTVPTSLQHWMIPKNSDSATCTRPSKNNNFVTMSLITKALQNSFINQSIAIAQVKGY